jgi:hypothetical protein
MIVSEDLVTEIGDESVPPDRQATVFYVPGRGVFDNPTATRAREMMSYQDDPWYATWTDQMADPEEEGVVTMRRMCEFLGAPVPDFAREAES